MNLANKPDLFDIQTAFEQMPDAPDWLWQGLAVWVAGKGIEWAWHHRGEIARAMGQQPAARPRIIRANINDGIGVSDSVTTTVSSERTASWNVLASVGSERTALWNVETPTPRQMKRLGDELLELGLWYVRLS